MKNKLIPFEMMPGSWGLKGKTRERAKAEYELEGEDLERALAKIDIEDKTQLDIKLLQIAKKYNRISERQYETDMVKLTKTGPDLELDLAYLSFKYKDITEREYNKKRATILNEPWVDIINFGINREVASQGTMELDWNDAFVSFIEKNGYKGSSHEESVDMWLTDVCKNLALEDLKNYMAQDEIDDFNERVSTKRKKNSDGKTENY